MKYRREIDGLRAISVLSVILFHAEMNGFSGGFVGVDIFFVISGYLITSIILLELKNDEFSLINFYERRARRILPALYLVMLACIPFAWLWMTPSAMKDFSQSLISVVLFSSNIYFWNESGYFDTAAGLKPLLHTWSLAVEEQYYLIFPIFIIVFWKRLKKYLGWILAALFLCSLFLAEYAVSKSPSAAYFLLPMRAWEILLGSICGFFLTDAKPINLSVRIRNLLAFLGIFLIALSIFSFNERTPFPGFYALIPTLGATSIILFAHPDTVVGRFLGNKVFVGIGLISFSAYLWHQPLFAFARYRSATEPENAAFLGLSVAALALGYISWRFFEQPFRKKTFASRKAVFSLAATFSIILITFGSLGIYTDGFSGRFNGIKLPMRWDPPIPCHGAVAVSQYQDPLHECLGGQPNGRPSDIFLLGDSHAAQFTFPLRQVAKMRQTDLFFVNLEDKSTFPYSFFIARVTSNDAIFDHLDKVMEEGDILVIAFHRGHLNPKRDKNLPLGSVVFESEKFRWFIENMTQVLQPLVKTGIKTYLVKDTPLLSDSANLEKCAFLKMDEFCSTSLEQDLHTRTLQQDAFDVLAQKFQGFVFSIDPLPIIYAGQSTFSPEAPDGSYRMFDRHHLTEAEALKLTEFFQSAIP